MITTDCEICCDTFNMGARKRVECPYCQIGVCMTCFKTYLMGLVSATPECMGCHKQLTLEFVAESTTKVFHNVEYRKNRAQIMMSQERSLLPDTQNLVEQRKIQNVINAAISELVDEEKYLKQRIKEISREKRDLLYHLDTMQPGGNVEVEKKKFIMGCPGEECRGFLSQAWKCGICDVYVCSKCRCVKEGRDDETHVCDPDSVATATMMKEETKPCPSCAVPIFKISGCPQMWCTECHTTFSWDTGKIETGVVHNPHYYQWQRDQNGGVAPRVPGDNVCGGLPIYQTVNRVILDRKENIPLWENMHRAVNHIRHVVLPRYPATRQQADNSDLRVSFLMKDITEIQWLKQLQLRQKKSEKCQDVHQILDLLVNALTDIFTRYVSQPIDLAMEADALRQYVNRELQKVKIKYANRTPFISVTWDVR